MNELEESQFRKFILDFFSARLSRVNFVGYSLTAHTPWQYLNHLSANPRKWSNTIKGGLHGMRIYFSAFTRLFLAD